MDRWAKRGSDFIDKELENIDREALYQSALAIVTGHLFADLASCEFMVEEDRDECTAALVTLTEIHEKYKRP